MQEMGPQAMREHGLHAVFSVSGERTCVDEADRLLMAGGRGALNQAGPAPSVLGEHAGLFFAVVSPRLPPCQHAMLVLTHMLVPGVDFAP